MLPISTPLFDKLNEYKNKKHTSFAMPGHKGGKGILKKFKKNIFKYDVTELEDTEDLHAPNHFMRESNKATSEFFGCLDSFYLVNGSTGGIFAMLCAACNPGDTIAVNRVCHISVINACAILGLEPVFIPQEIIPTFSIPEAINQKSLVNILDTHDVKAVLITSPSYYGLCSDIETISKITHTRGIPLLVDEAHGAHFSASKRVFPKSSILQNADIVVQSAHKTLNAMNQSAFLHFNSDMVNKNKLRSALSMLQTSSPSYPIVISADLARKELQSGGKWENVYERCEYLRNKITATTNVQFITTMLNYKYNIAAVDETRIVMNFAAYNTTGFKISEILRTKYKIDIEMADLFNVVCIATPSNKERDFVRLENAIISICKNLEPSESEPAFPAPPIPKMTMSPQKAFYSNSRNVRLDEALGCVSRSTIVAYPPAVPIICAGELVDQESIGYINALKSIGAQIVGLNENGFISIVD